MIDYFEILNVSENAEKEVIKASYKALAKKYHPDTSSENSDEPNKKMQLINEAYKVLIDDDKREEYLSEYKLSKQNKNVEDNKGKSNIDDIKDDDDDEDEKIDRASSVMYVIIMIILGVFIVISLFRFGPEMFTNYFNRFANKFR